MTVPGLRVEITIATQSGRFVNFGALDLSGVASVLLTAQAVSSNGDTGSKVEVRLDSATGPLIGSTPFISPSTDSLPGPYRPTLRSTQGTHDVYLLFRCETTLGFGHVVRSAHRDVRGGQEGRGRHALGGGGGGRTGAAGPARSRHATCFGGRRPSCPSPCVAMGVALPLEALLPSDAWTASTSA